MVEVQHLERQQKELTETGHIVLRGGGAEDFPINEEVAVRVHELSELPVILEGLFAKLVFDVLVRLKLEHGASACLIKFSP